MTALIPPIVFYAVDRSTAEARALAWARANPRIVTASVESCDPTRLGESQDGEVAWHVVLEVTWDTDPEQRGLWDE